MYKQDELIFSLGGEQNNYNNSSESLIMPKELQKMDLGEKNIVEMIAKVIEEGKL